MQEFAVRLVENIIASIPQIVLVLTTLIYWLNKVKGKTEQFPIEVLKTKQEMAESFTLTKNSLTSSISEFKMQLSSSFVESKKQMFSAFDDFKNQLVKDVTENMVLMKNQLSVYHKELVANTNQNNLLVMENKVFMDVISLLISQDPQKIKDGIASAVSVRLGMAREELENLPEVLIKNLSALEQALRETILVGGEKALQALMESLGYGKIENNTVVEKNEL